MTILDLQVKYVQLQIKFSVQNCKIVQRELLFLRKQLVCSKTRMATLETHQAEVLPELPATLEKYIENERNKLH